ncbi:MAG TPA: tyrosine--tRNA ligase [Candidatus Limnocylindrales bacterium]|nr:tyrosine--tRNA ligase [Candidatus Limnocylindrales bacterium]
MSDTTLSQELQWRGFVNQTTFKSATELDGEPLTFYWGVDPSAPSMTIGNLAAAMMVRHFIEHGHHAVLLIGGATGMIGDPDGKTEERNLKTPEEININKAAIAAQYTQIFGGQQFKLVDNYEWFKDMGYLQFLRDIGKHVPMRQMLGREFVQTRLSEQGAGISYAEFSYVLIQAYDFLYMNREMGVSLQVCGSDQWGNSIAGVDLIRRLTGNEAHVWSTPLIINKATGQKFGKTENGAVWLDENLTSVYQFYQFWLNTDDVGVQDYLKIYTLLSKGQIENILAEFKTKPSERLAQKTLAYEVTKLVHGESKTNAVVKASKLVFRDGDLANLSSEEIRILRHELPFAEVQEGSTFADALVSTGLASSKSDARRLIEQGAVNCNGSRDVTGAEDAIHKQDGIDGYLVLFKGNQAAMIEVK